jgi:hypothetical protein
MTAQPADPVVAAFVTALNAGDRDAFFAVLTDDATMSDDGSERDLADWTTKEIFSASGHLEIESQSRDGRSLVADYANETYGHMRTRWSFTVQGDRISRFETGQA